MRIFVIRQPINREVDGLDLSRFKVGREYEVGTRVGSYMLAARLAEFVDPSGRRVMSRSERRSHADRRQTKHHRKVEGRRTPDRRRADRRTR
jgi:hypothetical protein